MDTMSKEQQEVRAELQEYFGKLFRCNKNRGEKHKMMIGIGIQEEENDGLTQYHINYYGWIKDTFHTKEEAEKALEEYKDLLKDQDMLKSIDLLLDIEKLKSFEERAKYVAARCGVNYERLVENFLKVEDEGEEKKGKIEKLGLYWNLV